MTKNVFATQNSSLEKTYKEFLLNFYLLITSHIQFFRLVTMELILKPDFSCMYLFQLHISYHTPFEFVPDYQENQQHNTGLCVPRPSTLDHNLLIVCLSLNVNSVVDFFLNSVELPNQL